MRILPKKIVSIAILSLSQLFCGCDAVDAGEG
jgi:hypothetical protein